MKKYEAFGSDDINGSGKKNKKRFFGGKLESGKFVFGKIGNFFSNNVKKLVRGRSRRKEKKAEKTDNTNNIDKEDKLNKSDNDVYGGGEEKGGFEGLGGIKNVPSHIGGALRKLSDKTIEVATGTTNYIKKKSSDFIISKDEDVIRNEIKKENGNFDAYLKNGDKDAKEEEYFNNKESDKEKERKEKKKSPERNFKVKLTNEHFETEQDDGYNEKDDCYLI